MGSRKKFSDLKEHIVSFDDVGNTEERKKEKEDEFPDIQIEQYSDDENNRRSFAAKKISAVIDTSDIAKHKVPYAIKRNSSRNLKKFGTEASSGLG